MNLPDLYYLESVYKPQKKFSHIISYCELTRLTSIFSCTNRMIQFVLNFVNLPDLHYLENTFKMHLNPLFSIVNWQDFTSIFSCTNTMIQNVLNFVNAIWVKFCHARFLNALKGMLATQEWPSTAMLHHFIKPTVANVCATRAHLFAQNPLKVIFSSLISQP